MKNENINSNAYSFKQLIKITKDNYFKEKEMEKKEEIAVKFICDPDVSYNLLNEYISKYQTSNSDLSSIYDSLETFYEVLQYSLPTEKNKIFLEFVKKVNPKKVNKSFEYLATKSPIKIFNDIYMKYSSFLNSKKNKDTKDKLLKILNDINAYIDEMIIVYNIDLGSYYFPPMEEYPIYAYNFYSFLFFKTLKKFREKKISQPFVNNKNVSKKYTNDEWIAINYNIAIFFNDVHEIFAKFDEKNISQDLLALKIIFFYFKCFEQSRNFLDAGHTQFKKVINCIYSEKINSDILDRFEFYRENEDIPVIKEEWDSIRINEALYIKFPSEKAIKIKHFKKDILSLDDENLLSALMSNDEIDYLNLDGLIQSSITKYNEKIENYSKKLLKIIFSSELYINNFVKHDKRFNLQNDEKKKLLESIFKGTNSELIFEEIWNNIFFLPFIEDELCGFNSRNQYSIFINKKYQYKKNTTFQKIIPLYHSVINSLFHEFTHNIALILAANFGIDNYETIIIKDDQELINLQLEYSSKYNQNSYAYSKFDDFGNLMEVELYGIRPRKYKTYSGLFCLDFNSYYLSPDDFKMMCVGLYNYKPNQNQKEQEKNNSQNDNLEEIIQRLMDSEIAKILKEYFHFDTKNINESFTEDGKPREYNDNFMINEEYSVDIDYCDKLDNL